MDRTPIELLISESGFQVGVYAVNLDTNERIEISGDRSFHAASTMKVPVMIEAFHQASKLNLDLDSPLTVRNAFTSLLDESPYRLNPEDDSDPEIYELIGSSLPTLNLIERMIVKSSNLATNILIETLGATAINDLMVELGSPRMIVRRGVEDSAAYRAGINNLATARSFSNLFELLHKGKVVDQKSSLKMLEILAGQEHNEGIPSHLANVIRICHKTGWMGDVYHDGGLVEPVNGSAFVLTVFTPGGGFEK